jgi:ABC-2 type transport system permease protein
VFRNRMMLPIIFVVPLVQLIILVYAATLELKSIKTCFVDLDHSTYSRLLIGKIQGTPFYKTKSYVYSYAKAEDELLKGKADLAVIIPKGFEKDIVRENKSNVQLLVNAINGTAAGLTQAYTTMIINDFSKNIASKTDFIKPTGAKNIEVTYSFWYNPKLNFKTFMVPGILVLLVTIICLLLTGMNIVREKELGTIEQINVTPVRKYQFVIGKLMPFWIIALFELAFGLTLGKILFNIPIIGSLWLIFLVVAVYLIGILSIGLIVSTITNTQQQSMFVSFFFMIVFILMSGLFTAIENMPYWAQVIDQANPVAHLVRMMRMIMLKGSDFSDIRVTFMKLCVIVVVVLTLAIRRYRKVA